MTMTMPRQAKASTRATAPTTTTALAVASTKLDEAYSALTSIDLRAARGNPALRDFLKEARERCVDTRAAVIDALEADAPRN